MRAQLVECLEQGSIGLSTGLFYPPAFSAPTQEVIGVASVLKSIKEYILHTCVTRLTM